MRVRDTLRVAGRARRVAHRRGLAFVDVGPWELVGLARDELGVAGDRHVGAEHRDVAVAHDDQLLDVLEVGQHLGEERRERVVEDDDLRRAVVHDVRELFGKEPDVQRVEHRAHRGDREVHLHVLLRVPHERGHAIARLHTELRERVRDAIRVDPHGGETRPPGTGVGPCDDLTVGVHGLAVAQHRREGERDILHRALDHGPAFSAHSSPRAAPWLTSRRSRR